MPRFTDNDGMEQHQIGGTNFGFSAKRLDDLGASEYTLGVIVVDGSGSVIDFWDQIKKAIKEAVAGCRRNPRADNMMLRVVLFDNHLTEVHGFKPLADIADNDYDNLVPPGNTTALRDATYTAVRSALEYGRALVARDYSVNAAVFVITDGIDNASKVSDAMVAEALGEARRTEALESIMPVLIGVNTKDSFVGPYLANFQKDAGFQQYIAIEDVTEGKLAKLGGFISRSMSSQSQSLGSGGPSKSLTF